ELGISSIDELEKAAKQDRLEPVKGDAVTTAISLFIVHEARQLGAPGHVIARMRANVAVDGVAGTVPLVGDAFDVVWRLTSAICSLCMIGLSARSVGSVKAAAG